MRLAHEQLRAWRASPVVLTQSSASGEWLLRFWAAKRRRKWPGIAQRHEVLAQPDHAVRRGQTPVSLQRPADGLLLGLQSPTAVGALSFQLRNRFRPPRVLALRVREL